MPLTPRMHLGSYEVTSLLGTGGMGEVYQARDTKLGRDVAVKILPESFAQNPERLARFEREARLLASLNHSNIATLYGFEQSGDIHFLVMELVPGETLGERLRKGPLPVDEALRLFRQVAEGLEAAHEKGIVHRDLKPANIRITPEDKVKVLDFGLAKALGGDPVAGDLSESPTITRDATETGVILGTAAYMSPEQARGKPVDKRTDIWAFGAVLYEALTGKVAFLGETVSDTIAKILEREPNWEALPEKAPAKIRSLLRRCLQTDPARRQHDIADARIEIEESLTEVPTESAESEKFSRKRVFWQSMAALAVILALVAAGLALWTSGRSSEPNSVARFALHLPDTHTLSPGLGGSVALSPDGNFIVHVGQEKGRQTQLYVRAIDRLEATPITGTEGAVRPFFSPDGEWVGFFAGEKLKKVSLKGGAPIILCEAVEALGGSWGEDGTILFTPGWADGLMRISAEGGTPETLLPASQGLEMGWPQFLPRGRGVLFTLYTQEENTNEEAMEIAVLSLETGEHRTLVEGWSARYGNGYLVVALAGSLYAARFDLERLELIETPVPVVEGVRMRQHFSAQFALSDNGSLVYVPGHARGEERTLLLVDRDGNARPLSDMLREFKFPQFSPDGKRLAVCFRENDKDDIWIFDLSKRKFDRLTFGGGVTPVWSPDGSRIVFSASMEKAVGLFWKPADGSGRAERLSPPTPEEPIAGSWIPQGNLLAFEQDFPGGGADIYILQMDGQQEPRPFADTPSINEYGPRVSPDGRWIAYTSNESGRHEVYVQPFPEGEGKWQISTGGGADAVWAPDGRELFYQTGSKLMAVTIEKESEFVAGTLRVLFEDDTIAWESILKGLPNYDISPDGQTFVMVKGEPPITQFNLVLNWLEEVKRLVPTED